MPGSYSLTLKGHTREEFHPGWKVATWQNQRVLNIYKSSGLFRVSRNNFKGLRWADHSLERNGDAL